MAEPRQLGSCDTLMAAFALSQSSTTHEDRASEGHNYGICLGTSCEKWVGDASTGGCAVARGPVSLGRMAQTLDYINTALNQLRFIR